MAERDTFQVHLPLRGIRSKRRFGIILFAVTFLHVSVIGTGAVGVLVEGESMSGTVGSLVVVVALTLGVLTFRDARSVVAEIGWETEPYWWAFVVATIPLVGSSVFFHRRVTVVSQARQTRFDTACDRFENQLAEYEDDMRPYLETEAYLTYHTHETLLSTYSTMETQLQALQQSANESRELSESHDRLETIEARLQRIDDILSDRERYNERFVTLELDRREEFFNDVGQEGYTLDQSQRKAIIRNETYNRVIAGAGTGKTLVLTTRVAYLVKYQDVEPDDILVITFLKAAAEEMKQRLRTDFGITDIEARTIHSFGYQVIDRVRGGQLDVFDEDDLEHFIEDILNKRREIVPEVFYDHFTQFLLYSELPTIREADFETKEALVERLREQKYETLGGETVKSRAEKIIADFLYIHRVDYQYEQRADITSQNHDDEGSSGSAGTTGVEDESSETGAYRPDFYIPAAEVYIEHYGIDEAGEVAEWFTQSSAEYIEKIQWAREYFRDTESSLIETYEFEYDTGRLQQALTHRLTHHGVTLDRRSYEELVTETYEVHERNIPIKRTVTRFIELARTFDIHSSDIPPRLSSTRPAQYYFGLCGGLLLEAYERHLENIGNIDFTDMVFEAESLLTDDVTTGSDAYEHVLVDEFQDVGRDQLRLIKALSGPDDARLFAVGDDWQSIYSFQGAVVDLFIDFEEEFGPTATTTLKTNYRSPSQVVQASTDLISQNDSQLDKEIMAESDAPAAVVQHLLGGYREYKHIKYTATLVAHLVEDYVESGCDPSDIMVLCRYDDAVDHLNAVRSRLHDRGINTSTGQQDDAVTVCSVHQAKGREADHVIVTHASEDGMGFPATDRNTELLDPVQEVDMNTLGEERRLFYVAITRAARTLDIISKSDQGDQSRFINEIDQYVDLATRADDVVSIEPTDDQSVLRAKVAHLWEDTHAKKHQDGILEDHTDSIRFVSWASNDPPTLEEDTWYRFDDIRVNEYKGEPQVVIARTAEVTEIEPEEAQVSVETIHHQLAEQKETAQASPLEDGDNRSPDQVDDDPAVLQRCPECDEVYIRADLRECSSCGIMNAPLDDN